MPGWGLTDDGKVVEFASEAEVIQYCESLEVPPVVMCELDSEYQLIGGT